MRATARSSSDTGRLEVRVPSLDRSADAWTSGGPADHERTPHDLLAASLASCTAVPMGLYARRKGWDVGEVEVEVDYSPAQRGSPTHCALIIRLPEDLPVEQRERLLQVGAKSEVHRTLEGEIAFEERIELTRPHVAQPAQVATAKAPSRRLDGFLNGLRDAVRVPRREPATAETSAAPPEMSERA